MYVDDLVLYDELEEDLRAMTRIFFKYSKKKKRGRKVNADKSKVIVLGEEEEFVWEGGANGRYLGHVLEFKYLLICLRYRWRGML